VNERCTKIISFKGANNEKKMKDTSYDHYDARATHKSIQCAKKERREPA
jgi:hypothetical protein